MLSCQRSFVDLKFVISILDGEIVHPANQERRACLLYSSDSNSQGLALFFFSR
jgi:hypothetical protein